MFPFTKSQTITTITTLYLQLIMSFYHINSHYIPLHPPIKSKKIWLSYCPSNFSPLTPSISEGHGKPPKPPTPPSSPPQLPASPPFPRWGSNVAPGCGASFLPSALPASPAWRQQSWRSNYGETMAAFFQVKTWRFKDVAQLWNPLSCCGSWRFCSTASDCCAVPMVYQATLSGLDI